MSNAGDSDQPAVLMRRKPDQDGLLLDRVQREVGDHDPGSSSQRQRDGLPAHDVPVVVGGARELRDREAAGGVEDVSLRPRATEGASAVQQRVDVGVIGLVALDALCRAEELWKSDELRDASAIVCQVAACLGIPEAQRSLAQVVAHPDQVVDFAEAPLGLMVVPRPPTLGTLNQPSAPAIWCAVRERAEGRPLGRGLLLAGGKWQQRVELVGVASGEIVGRVAERRRLVAAGAVRPHAAGQHVGARELDDDLDLVVSHRRRRSSRGGARAAEAAPRSGAARRRSRTDRVPGGGCRGRRAPAGSAASSPS